MMYTTGASVEESINRFAPTTSISGRPRHRPKALQIQPLDPSELSVKLNHLSVDNNGQPSHPAYTEDSLRSPLSAQSMGAPSPRTIPRVQSSSSVTTTVSSKPSRKEKLDGKLNLPSPSKPPRRGSIFDAFRFRGSNYTDEAQKQEEDSTQKPVRYKHVPQVAAQQFARTTTVEPLSQKASPKGLKPAPGPHSMNVGTMSLQEYNRQYRRAQSLCNGRAVGLQSRPRLASTAETDKEIAQQRNQNARRSMPWNGNGPELSRRMSTGNLWGKNETQPPSLFRRDSAGMGSQTSSVSSVRRGSASSSGFSDASSSFARESLPVTPFKQDFGGSNSPQRRGSEHSAVTSGSRRGSFVNVTNPQYTAEIHRVDWSQSDQPVKTQRDPKWGGLKHRKTSVSQQRPDDEKEIHNAVEAVSQQSVSRKSPKSGFLKRFMH
ncbi:hypothetical protein FHETE_9949 [Fusarium heterosporum]|uniref:Uncharacterized protein n=1 Tax=Fusarium heterosporum TaxID=42747 RepID=A0A8H5WH54_FUSHE|nr:hypothetical protein FHETE_9949 [Fusarium heterosporum]